MGSVDERREMAQPAVPKSGEVMQEVKALEDTIPSRERTESGKIAICYNKRCPDFKVERDYDVACGCKKTRIQGAGT